MIRKSLVSVALTLLAVFVSAPVWAGAPTDQLKTGIDRVIKVLEDPSLKPESKAKDRRAAVRKIANEIFDFSETAKRSLARHWQGRSEKEREEFVGLFSDLLERSYIGKIDLYGGEKVLYVNETIDNDTSTVRTRILTKQGNEVAVDYRLLKRGDRWMVYDVILENVSLVSNYRTQFNKIIQTASYQELVKKMKTKQDEFLVEEQAAQKKGVKQ
jgi:phospholipid transport system substrate-binding protein